jgi:hypothetical protein
VIIDGLNIQRATVHEVKADWLLRVNADAPLPAVLPLQRLQPVAGRWVRSSIEAATSIMSSLPYAMCWICVGSERTKLPPDNSAVAFLPNVVIVGSI